MKTSVRALLTALTMAATMLVAAPAQAATFTVYIDCATPPAVGQGGWAARQGGSIAAEQALAANDVLEMHITGCDSIGYGAGQGAGSVVIVNDAAPNTPINGNFLSGLSTSASFTATYTAPATLPASWNVPSTGAAPWHGINVGLNNTVDIVVFVGNAGTVSGGAPSAPAAPTVAPMAPESTPTIAKSLTAVTCSAGAYSQQASFVAYSLLVDGEAVATSMTDHSLPLWVIPHLGAVVTTDATLSSATFAWHSAWAGKKLQCAVLAYANHATGHIHTDEI